MFFVHYWTPGSLVSDLPLRAILLPRIVGTVETKVRPASAVESLVALAPSSIRQTCGEGHATLQSLARVNAKVRSFVLEVAAAENRARFGLRSGTAFRTILFTDIEQHGDLLRKLGDSRGRQLLREHERITREALRAIPEGTYRYVDHMDNDGIELDRRIRIVTLGD